MVQLTSGQQSEAFNLIEPDHRLLLMGKQTVFRLCPCARVLMHLSLVRNSGLLFCYMYFELELLRLCIIGRKINQQNKLNCLRFCGNWSALGARRKL